MKDFKIGDKVITNNTGDINCDNRIGTIVNNCLNPYKWWVEFDCHLGFKRRLILSGDSLVPFKELVSLPSNIIVTKEYNGEYVSVPKQDLLEIISYCRKNTRKLDDIINRWTHVLGEPV